MRKLLEVTWVSAYILFACLLTFFHFPLFFLLMYFVLIFSSLILSSHQFFFLQCVPFKILFIVLYLFFIYIVFHFLGAPPKSSSSFRPSRDEVARIIVQDIIWG